MSAFIAEKKLEKIRNHVLHVAQRAPNFSFTIAGSAKNHHVQKEHSGIVAQISVPHFYSH
jgi:hypothetical protein